MTAVAAGERYQLELAAVGWLILDTERKDSVHPRGKLIWAQPDELGAFNGYWQSERAARDACDELNHGTRVVLPRDGVLTAAF